MRKNDCDYRSIELESNAPYKSVLQLLKKLGDL